MATHSKRTSSSRSVRKRASAKPSRSAPKKSRGIAAKSRLPAKAKKLPKPKAKGRPKAKSAKAGKAAKQKPESVPSPLVLAAAAGDIQGRIRELIKLAKEQGYLTFDDLNESLPAEVTDADELDAILTRLRRMEIDIIEASEVDRYKDGNKNNEEGGEGKPGTKRDLLEDPVRR